MCIRDRLSFAYSLLSGECASALEAVGLDAVSYTHLTAVEIDKSNKNRLIYSKNYSF